MIDLTVDSCYIDDLWDDFAMNENLDLYEFIGNDPVKAFYLGIKYEDWLEKLRPEQQYLYTKQARHNKDKLLQYESQITFWTNKFSNDDTELINLSDLSEYVLNNMFYNDEKDAINLAFYFGNMIHDQMKKDEKEPDNMD
jgi:hypothetical protein